MIEIDKNYNIDCVEGMKMIDGGVVDLVITSPPYEDLRQYKGFQYDTNATIKELYRILKKGGVVVWIIGDKTKNGSESGESFRQALRFMEVGFNLHDTMIYSSDKPPLTHNRYEQKFEYMFIFSKGKPKTFNPIMEDCKYAGSEKSKRTFRQEDGTIRETNGKGNVKHEKIKGNIWFYPTGYNKSTTDKIAFKHPAIFPERLVEDHVKTWSNEGDLILDPFSGSGTTEKVCRLMNRKFLGFEISGEYCEIARKRMNSLGKGEIK